VLGRAGATTPSVYNLQGLVLNGGSRLTVVGPVVINLAAGVTANASIGTAGHPQWLASTWPRGRPDPVAARACTAS
jgi:hypothetical protein